jgi:hypothetical protein
LRRAALFALPLVPAVLLYAHYTAHHAGIDPAVRCNWGGWARKLVQPLTLFHTYDWRFDVVVIALWLGAVLAAFGLKSMRALRPSWLLLALAALTALYLVIPFQLGTTDDTDARILPAVLVCALAALAAAGTLSPTRFRLAAALLALGIGVRYYSVVRAWDELGRRLEPLVQGMQRLEPESRVLHVLMFPAISKDYPERHFLAWAVTERRIFYPGMLHHRDQQPLVLRVPCPDPVRRGPGAWEVEADARRWYDYVWVVNLAGRPVHVPAEFEQVYAGGPLTLWRVR